MQPSRWTEWIPVLAGILALFLAGAAGARAGEGDALLAALDKAAQGGKPFKDMVAEVKPVVQGAAKPAHDAALAKLKDEYTSAKGMLDEKGLASSALRLSILGMAASELNNMALFGEIRLLPWQEVYDIADSSRGDQAQQVEAAAKVAKLWQPLWDNLFDEVIKGHRAAESTGSAVEMKRCIVQMELLAEAAKKAFGREDLVTKAKSFKDALERYKDLSPEKRAIKQEADEALQRARHKFEAKEFEPAKEVLNNKAILLYEKLEDKRGLGMCYMLHAEIREGEKLYSEILDWLEKAKKYAQEAADQALINEIAEYEKKLKEREKAGEFTLTKNPFVIETNLGPEETIRLNAQYGPVKDSRPLPQAFENPHFWRPVELQRGTDEKGKRKDILRLELEGGTEQFYLIWDDKGDVKLASDEKGANARPFKFSASSPSKEGVNISYWILEKNKNVPMRYEFLVVENLKVTIAGAFRDCPKSDAFLSLRIHSNTYREGKLDGQRLLICDDNVNGLFNEQSTPEVGNSGLDHAFWGCDTIVLGTGKPYTTLYGSLIKSKNKYYFIHAADKAGTVLTVKEYKGPRGKVSLKFNGGKAANVLHFVIGTSTGGQRLGFINLGGEKGPVEVPTGSYFFKWGLLCAGNNPEKNDRLEIWKGKYPDFKVNEGQTVEIECGGPFDVQMEVPVESGVGELKTYTLKVFGAKGEEYRRFWPKPFLSDYKIKDSAGVLVESGKLRAFNDQDPVEPVIAIGMRVLEFAFHVNFAMKNAQAKAPFKAEFKTAHPLLGNIETAGWK